MSRELILLRHAKTEWDNPQGDFARELTRQGVEEASTAGAWLVTQKIAPVIVYCSNARRVQQTWETLLAATQWQSPEIIVDSRLYLADLTLLRQLLTAIPAHASCVLFIGHNPGLEQLAAFLSAQALPRNTVGEILATANVVRLSLPDNWENLSAGSATLLNVFRPQNY